MCVCVSSRRLDVNAKSNLGNTALHFASGRNNPVFLRELLQDERFDIHAVNEKGQSILDIAALTEHAGREDFRNFYGILEDGRLQPVRWPPTVQPTVETFKTLGLYVCFKNVHDRIDLNYW